MEFLGTGGSEDDICLAGHSLGAGIALLAGKHLAASGIEIDTHLFAPPLLTLASFVSGDFLPENSTPDQRHPNVLTNVSSFFFNKLSERMQESGVGIAFDTDEMQHSGVGVVGNAIVELFGEKDLDEEWEEFQKLRNWVPHFYLNRCDIVSLQYIKYYEDQMQNPVAATRHNIDISRQGIISRLFGRDAKYINNVVPSANLYISKKYEGHLVKSHSLRQWHRFSDAEIGLEQSRVRLLADYKRHFAERAARYAGNKIHDLCKNMLAKTVRQGSS